jgi:hypothetical protein
MTHKNGKREEPEKQTCTRFTFFQKQGKRTCKQGKRNLMFLVAGCSLWWIKGFYCSLDVLHGDIRIRRLAIFHRLKPMRIHNTEQNEYPILPKLSGTMLLLGYLNIEEGDDRPVVALFELSAPVMPNSKKIILYKEYNSKIYAVPLRVDLESNWVEIYYNIAPRPTVSQKIFTEYNGTDTTAKCVV